MTINKYNESIKAAEAAIRIAPRNADMWTTKGAALYIMAKNNETLDRINETSEHIQPQNNYTCIQSFNGSIGHKEVWEYSFNISKQMKRIAAGLNRVSNEDSELLLVLENPHGNPFDAVLGSGNLGSLEAISPESGQWKVKVYGYGVSSGNVAFHIYLINQTFLLERYNESLNAYDTALSRNPNSIDALNSRAFVLCDSNRANEAIVLLDKSLKISPLNPGTWYLRGESFKKQGKYQDALQCFNNAIDLAPSYADALTERTATLYLLGRTAEANSLARIE